MTTTEDTITIPAVAEATSDDPLAGLDASQRAEMEASRQHWGEPAKVDPTGGALSGVVRKLSTVSAPPVSLRGPLAGAGSMTDEQKAHADRLIAAAEKEARELAEQARKANRHASYLRNRESHYANASYETLRPDQNPRSRVSNWLDRGPRALTLAGSPRTGKTTAGHAITNDAHLRGVWVEVWTARRLATAIMPTGGDPTAWARATDCELLLLDDLSRERVTDFWRDMLQELLEVRFGAGRRLLVTANTSANPEKAYDELVDVYGDPVVERILDGGGIVMFDGPPIRNLVTEW